jgi:hypothetical protein
MRGRGKKRMKHYSVLWKGFGPEHDQLILGAEMEPLRGLPPPSPLLGGGIIKGNGPWLKLAGCNLRDLEVLALITRRGRRTFLLAAICYEIAGRWLGFATYIGGCFPDRLGIFRLAHLSAQQVGSKARRSNRSQFEDHCFEFCCEFGHWVSQCGRN